MSNYWHSQQYTLQEFKNRTHQSVDAVLREKKSASPKPSPQQVMLEMEKRRKLNEVREAQISAEPPVGLTWQDISAVKNVFYSGKSTYFAEIRWMRPDVVSYIPTRIIRRNNPLKVRKWRHIVLTCTNRICSSFNFTRHILISNTPREKKRE